MLSIKQLTHWMARPWVRRTALLLFFAFVATLLTKQAMMVEWAKVAEAIRAVKATTLAIATGLAVLSYLIYSCFDLLGRAYTRVQLPAHSVMKTAFISYAFNQSLGSLVGGVAFRFRLYSRLGLNSIQISKIVLLSVVTNWLGYSAIAGTIFIAGAITMPPGWEIGEFSLQLVGWVFVLTASAYMVLCAFYADREFSWRQYSAQVPHLPLASMQLLLSVIHWPVAAAILYVLLDQQIPFIAVLGALLLSAIAAALAHIPAGVGVLEAIFVGLFGESVPVPELLAALVIFRVVYYLTPLAIATVTYFATESQTSDQQAVQRKTSKGKAQSSSLLATRKAELSARQ